MFLDPEHFVVLDKHIGRLNGARTRTILTRLKIRRDGWVECTQANRQVYTDWCGFCKRIAKQLGDDDVRAVDVERGVYRMIEGGRLNKAAEIIAAFQ